MGLSELNIGPGPERHARERQALDTAGIPVTAEETDGEDLVWTCRMQHDYDRADVTVRIHGAFPWLPPHVTSPEPFLERHQVPSRDGNFCLDRSDAPWWRPEHTIAQLLTHLQALLDADTDGTARIDEADMPEPASAPLSGRGLPLVLIPATLLHAHLPVGDGVLEVAAVDGRAGQWVITGLESGGTRQSLGHETEPRAFPRRGTPAARIPFTDLGNVRDRRGVDAARRAVAEMPGPAPVRRHRGRPPSTWRAITFMEEGPTRERTRRAWAFAELGGPSREPRWATTQALSLAARDERRAALAGIDAARVVIVGVGAVGSQVAMLLAQAGVRDLRLVDHDEFDINNGVRHVLPAAAAGHPKAEALADLLNSHQPFTRARAHTRAIGTDGGSLRFAAAQIQEADLVIDATGAPMVSRFLGHAAAHHRVPIVHTALLAGAEHGYVLVRRPATGCLDHFLGGPHSPLPPAGELPNATPYGCSHPAVSCAPFEPAALAAHAARTVAGILPTAGYEHFEGDWLIVQLRHGGTVSAGTHRPVPGCGACTP